ncbi:MAG: phosphatase PAP2 family protein [Flavisolibacter sp.]
MEAALSEKAKGISLRFLMVATIFILSLLLFIFIADEMVLERENNLDVIAFQKLAAITNPATTKAMLFITFFGSSYFLLPAYLILIFYFLVFKKDRRLSLDVAAIGIISTIILFSLKAIFHRHRPLDPLVKAVNGFSFPSGHSFSSFTFFGLLIYIIWNHKIRLTFQWTFTFLFFLFACAIAFSRVYLHVHYASDVVAGFCLCIVWLGFSFWAMRKFKYKLE